MKSLYGILGVKRKNSVLKSMVVSKFDDGYANVRIEIEAYDDTFINAYEQKGSDYIFKQLEKHLKKSDVRDAICQALNINEFKSALVTLYGGRHIEMYFKEDGVNQYGIEW